MPAKQTAKTKPPPKPKSKKPAAPKYPSVDLTQVTAELCRRSLSFFVREFWDEVVTDPCVWNWHMDVMCNEIQAVYERVFLRLPKQYDLIINVPPGSSKSTIASVMAPIWAWTRDPVLRIISASYTSKLSTNLAVKSRNLLRCAKFRRMFPHLEIATDQNEKGHYANVYMGERLACSPDGTVTGFHAHVQVVDDPLNPKEAASQKDIENAQEFMDETLSQRKVDKALTPLILIMQRLSTADPTGHLLNKKGKKIRHVCLPAEYDTNISPAYVKELYTNGLLDENRISRQIIEEAKTDLGTAGHAGQYQQRPAPKGGIIWKQWFIPVPDEYFPSRAALNQYGTDWDLALTKDEENSASAYVSGGKIKERIYIDDIGFAWLEFPELIKYMKQRAAPHYIEAKASGKSSKQVLTRAGITAVEVKVKGDKDKIARANNATPTAESGRVYVRASILDRLYNDHRQGILFFPRGAFNDLADALAQFLQRLGGNASAHVANEQQSDLIDDDY